LDPIDNEAVTLLIIQTNELIHTWLRRYIGMYYPKYSFEEIVESIKIIHVSDEIIEFRIFDPHNRKYESFEIPRSFLEDIKEETRRLVEKAIHKNNLSEVTTVRLTSQIYGVIKSWLPDINSEEIIGVNTLSRVKNGSLFDYLKVYYYGENGNIKDEYIPNIFK